MRSQSLLLAFFSLTDDKYRHAMIRRRWFLPLTVVISALVGNCAQTSSLQSLAKDASSQEAAVIESMATKVAFENDGNFNRVQISRVRVQTDAGVKAWGILSFPFQSATQIIEIDYVRVRKVDGSTIVTPPDNIQDLDSEITRSAPFYSDLREKHVAVKGLGKGDSLEYAAHWHTTKPLIPGQFWFEYNFHHEGIVLSERVEIKVPEARAVKVKGPQTTQTVTTESGSRIYGWTYSRLENTKEPENDQRKQTEAALGRLPAPDVQMSSFQSWEDVGRWYWSLQKERVEPTEAIRAKAAELTKGMTDDATKLRALYSFVSTQYRYIGIAFGIGRYQPHAAEDVLTNNYGDCKDKHTLLAALLKASGITIYPALVTNSRTLDADVPSPAQFDHIIGYLPPGKGKDKDKDQNRERDAVWIDTTPEVAPFGLLIPTLRDKQALVMTSEKSIQLVTTASDPPFPSTETFKIEGKIDDEGTFEAKAAFTSRGDSELLMRLAFRQVPQPQWKELMQQISYGLGFSGTVSDVSASAPESIADAFHFSYSYNRKDYPDWKSNQRFTVPGLPFSMPPLRDDASYPVWLGSPMEIISDSKVELPLGRQPQTPSSVDLKYDFAEYHASYSQKNGALIASRRLLTKMREIPAAKFEDYRNFIKNMDNDINQYVMTSYAGDDLAKRGYEAEKNEDYASAVELLTKAAEADPKSKTLWNDLGLAYLSLKKDDLAISSFQKQIEVSPNHQYAFNNMGRVYLKQAKYEDAVKYFKRQIEINPLDKYAHSNIGIAYLAQHKYEEAIPELEQAVSVTPDDSYAKLRLGNAYLKAGQIEKGTTTLEKVVESKPEPTIWNDVAYEFAVANVNLSKALDYAQHAVHAQEIESHNVLLSNLRPSDLACVVKIGAYWDTLGWVHFRLGHLDQAESYLYAAWLLSEGGIEADHLGQVYEQQKKMDQAIHMYRLALSTPESHGPGGGWDEMRHRLEVLTGAKATTTPDLIRADPDVSELDHLRSVKLKGLQPGTATGEFFLLFSPGSKVPGVQFVSGAERLRSARDALSAAEFQVAFPQGSSAHVLRRVLVTCSDASGCDAVLFTPNSVKSVK
jgi:tetratricopeptide (TPR) repeat protein